VLSIALAEARQSPMPVFHPLSQPSPLNGRGLSEPPRAALSPRAAPRSSRSSPPAMDADATPAILDALVEGGADVIELGMPFTDPMADGPAIQLANLRSLGAGTTTAPSCASPPVPRAPSAGAAGADGLCQPDDHSRGATGSPPNA
jgi:hypothetical protein